MWAFRQLWLWMDLAAFILIFIGVVTGAVKYKTRPPLWAWILICIGVGLVLLSIPVAFIQLSVENRKKKADYNNIQIEIDQ